MSEKVTNPIKCIETVSRTLDELENLLTSLYPDLSSFIHEIRERTEFKFQTEVCSKLISLPKPEFTNLPPQLVEELIKSEKPAHVSVDSLVRSVTEKFVVNFVDFVVLNLTKPKLDLAPLIYQFPDVFSKDNVLYVVFYYTSTTYPSVLNSLLFNLARTHGIPPTNVETVINSIRVNFTTPQEILYGYSLAMTYVKVFGELPADIVTYHHYYLSALPDEHFRNVLCDLPDSLIVPTFYHLLPRLAIHVYSLAILTNEYSLINAMFNFAIIDKTTLEALNLLNEYNVLPDEYYEETISLLFHLSHVITHAFKYYKIARIARINVCDFTKEAFSRFREKLLKYENTFTGILIGIAYTAYTLSMKLYGLIDELTVRLYPTVKKMKAFIEAYVSVIELYNKISIQLHHKELIPEPELKEELEKLHKFNKMLYALIYYRNYLLDISNRCMEILRQII